ncbi:MAG TPA: lycopene beta-cyclase CrtY [Novosphingobium sp.]|nr:lycopene beta-cyclase CrtY [Novosphingobium sp.]
MHGRRHDIAIAGGGLAGGLVALALRRARPELSVVLVEQGAALGGNHRWSWFDSDLSGAGRELLAPLRITQWDRGYDVRFPAHSRTLGTAYRSLASPDFDAGLRRELADGTIRTRAAIAALDAGGITLSSGEHIAARTVIDCRGLTIAPALRGGWQVFMGRHLRTAVPHGVERPVIMDAALPQHGAYRFVYVLPLGARELFVEDTCYADGPVLDRRALSARIDAYCAEHGWSGELLGHETGVLPVISGGNFGAFRAAHRVPGVAIAGARGGFMHPLTSYTLPFAVETALTIAAEADLPGQQLAALIEARAQRHWSAMRFYRHLGAMLFQAGEPEQRYRIFERFYRLPQPLIERFYAGRSTLPDRTRVLCGKPPVPIAGAIRALTTKGAPLLAPGPALAEKKLP